MSGDPFSGDYQYAADYDFSAQIAELAYESEDFQVGMTGDSLLTALQNADVSFKNDSSLLREIADNYEVIGVFNSPEVGDEQPGLNSLILKDVNTGALIVSTSGVDGLTDISFTASRTLQYGFNDVQYAQLRSFALPIIMANAGSIIDIVGHSLGGQLSHVLFADLYKNNLSQYVRNVTTFGSFGIVLSPQESLLFPPAVPDYAALLGILGSVIPAWKIVNFSNEGDPVPFDFGKLWFRPGHDMTLDVDGDGYLNLAAIDVGAHDLVKYISSLVSPTNNVSPITREFDLWRGILSQAILENTQSLSLVDRYLRSLLAFLEATGELSEDGIGDDALASMSLSGGILATGSLDLAFDYIDYSSVATRRGLVTVLPNSGDVLIAEPILLSNLHLPGAGIGDGSIDPVVLQSDAASNEGDLASPETAASFFNGIDWTAGGVAASQALASTLGRRLFGDSRLVGATAGAALGQIASGLSGRLLNPSGLGENVPSLLSEEAARQLGTNIAGAGVGAVTAYLVGEVFAELGIEGFAGEALNATTSFALSTIASNITQQNAPFQGLGNFNFANFAGSFLGSKLASFVRTFDSVGGQIGFSVGSTVGSVLATSLLKGTGIVANFLAPGVGALVGALLGGLIGSLFGGDNTPESGAHVVWNASRGEFVTGQSWADDWGSSANDDKARDRAIGMAQTAADALNRVLHGLGDSAAAYQNPTLVGTGAYGQENQDFLYWGNGEDSQSHALTGRYEDAMQAVNHGLRIALDSVALQGGDVYLKRALYRSLESNRNRATFDISQVIGDLAVAADYSFYKKNSRLIDTSIGLAPGSSLAQGWVLTLLRTSEMKIDEYFKSDFYGGLHSFLEGSAFAERTGADLADIEVSWQSNGDLLISDGELVPVGNAHLPGWSHYSAETTRWRMVAGPSGDTITAMETGQHHAAVYGGGVTSTNTFEIDGSRAYEYTIYVQGHQLNKHRAYFGTMSGTVVNAVTGGANNNPYFWHAIPGNGNTMQADRWYKVVGYILPEGERLTSQSQMGGVYDTETGQKIANVTNFAWNPSRSRTTSAIRFFNYYAETDTGYSTYWHAPQVHAVEDGKRVSDNLIDLKDWPIDPTSSVVIPEFSETMGYLQYANRTTNFVGTIYSDIVTAIGSNNITISDSTAATSANGPGMAGDSRLSDDIFIGNDGHNQIYGYAGWDWLDGGAGVDRISGGDGNDFIKGGAGNDYVQSWTSGPAPGGLYGGTGDDTIVGGDGKDALFGEAGDDLLLADQDSLFDYLHGGTGSDTVSYRQFDNGVTINMNVGKDTAYTYRAYGDGALQVENVTGSAYNDTLIGDTQANILDGAGGDDSLQGGSGNDILIGGTGADVLQGGAGLDTVSYRHSKSGVVVSLLSNVARGGDAYGDLISTAESIEGSQNGDDLQAGSAAGSVSGLDGSDIMRASSGAIRFDGGDGIDTVDYSASSAAVTVNLGSGIGSGGWASGDTYHSIEQVIGSGFNDYLYGTAASERFQGGAGTDRQYGYGGDDSYAFTHGGGIDYIADSGGFYDYVVIDNSITLNDLTMSRSGSTLIVGRHSTTDKVYVQNHYLIDGNGLHTNTLDQIAFANGSTFWVSDLNAFYNGTSSSESITGAGSHDWLHGHSGNDVLTGNGGLDVLVGGAGTDTLRGGVHNDTYIFGRGSGIDTIQDTADLDTLVFAGDIKSSDLIIAYSGNDAYIGLAVEGENYTAFNAPDRVVIKGQKLAASAIEILQINGQRLSLPKLLGDSTGESNPPQISTTSFTIYARFTGGWIGNVSAFDPDGDQLTYTVTSYNSLIGAEYYFPEGTNRLYTTAFWNRQDFATDGVNVLVSDGTHGTGRHITVEYRPDPNGGVIWPVVLDLDGNGVNLLSTNESSVAWDVNEDGFVDRMGWISSGDALLALDRDGSGSIDHVSEISFIQDAEGATTDLEGLRGFDFDAEGQADGVLDANDVFFADFELWQDLDGDGVCDAGELRSLADHGISSIDLAPTPTGEAHTETGENAILNSGTFHRSDGSTGQLGDVVLGVRHGESPSQTGTSPDGVTRGEIGSLFEHNEGQDDTLEQGGLLAPIIIDFDFSGINLVSVARSTVNFDADNDGQLERIGWIADGDAILALDLNADGKITSGQEISFSQYVQGASSDLEGLRAFDENGDRVLNEQDSVWADLKLWFDRNGDAQTQEGELVTLGDSGLASIQLYGQDGRLVRGGNVINEVAKVTFKDREGFAGFADVSLGYLELAPAVDAVEFEERDPSAVPPRDLRQIRRDRYNRRALGDRLDTWTDVEIGRIPSHPFQQGYGSGLERWSAAEFADFDEPVLSAPRSDRSKARGAVPEALAKPRRELAPSDGSHFADSARELAGNYRATEAALVRRLQLIRQDMGNFASDSGVEARQLHHAYHSPSDIFF